MFDGKVVDLESAIEGVSNGIRMKVKKERNYRKIFIGVL